MGALAAIAAPALTLDWQPALAWRQPWRWWSAVFVHYSLPHLAGNLLATALVAAYGWAAQVPSRVTAAWFIAWPLMHLALIRQEALQHYGGLSGLMHAGVAAVNAYLVVSGVRGQKVIGGIVLFMLIMKVVTETPWRGAVQHSPDWDIPIAPIAHLTGLVAGLVCGVLIEAVHRRRMRAGRRPTTP